MCIHEVVSLGMNSIKYKALHIYNNDKLYKELEEAQEKQFTKLLNFIKSHARDFFAPEETLTKGFEHGKLKEAIRRREQNEAAQLPHDNEYAKIARSMVGDNNNQKQKPKHNKHKGKRRQ